MGWWETPTAYRKYVNEVERFLKEISMATTASDLSFMESRLNIESNLSLRKRHDVTFALSELIIREWREDGFISVITFGRQGFGKSVYNMLVAYDVLSYLARNEKGFPPVTWRDVIDYYVYFDLKDIVKRLREQAFGRIPVLVWDDAGVHGSGYYWFVDKKRIMLISALFQTVRTKLNALLLNAPSPRYIARQLRDVDSIIVLVVKGPKKYSIAHGYRVKYLPSGKPLIEKIFIDTFERSIPEYDYYLEKRKKYTEYAIGKLMELIEEDEKRQDLVKKLSDPSYIGSLAGEERKRFLTELKKFAIRMKRTEKHFIIRKLLEAGFSYGEIVYALNTSERTIAKIAKELNASRRSLTEYDERDEEVVEDYVLSSDQD